MGDFNVNIDEYHEHLKLYKNTGWKFDLIEGLSLRNYTDLQSCSNDDILPTFFPS